MNKIILNLALSMIFFTNLQSDVLDSGDKDPQLLVALELVHTCRDDDTAFIACKTALEKHKNNQLCNLFIKEIMVFCPISTKFEDDMELAADYVVKNSSDPIYMGVAWYRKAENSYRNNRLIECTNYCDIALKFLDHSPDQCEKGNIGHKTMYEILALIKKQQCFKNLKQPEKITEIEKKLLTYPAYVKFLNEKD